VIVIAVVLAMVVKIIVNLPALITGMRRGGKKRKR
jgi:hypothetical protein